MAIGKPSKIKNFQQEGGLSMPSVSRCHGDVKIDMDMDMDMDMTTSSN